MQPPRDVPTLKAFLGSVQFYESFKLQICQLFINLCIALPNKGNLENGTVNIKKLLINLKDCCLLIIFLSTLTKNCQSELHVMLPMLDSLSNCNGSMR